MKTSIHQFAFLSLVFIWTAACSSKNSGQPGAGPQETILKYSLSENGCETGEHSARSKAEICELLKQDDINNNCAFGLRKEKFEADECGDFYSSTYLKAYQFNDVEEKCDTGSHISTSRRNMCEQLIDDVANHNCAARQRVLAAIKYDCPERSKIELPSTPFPRPSTPTLKPDTVTVEGVGRYLRSSTAPMSSSGAKAVFVTARIENARLSPEINDQLSLRDSKSTTVRFPELKGCRKPNVTIGNVGFGVHVPLWISSIDESGQSACQDFAKRAVQEGLVIEFTYVPMLNDKSHFVRTVTVSVLPVEHASTTDHDPRNADRR